MFENVLDLNLQFKQSSKPSTMQMFLQKREQKEITRSQVGRVLWVGDQFEVIQTKEGKSFIGSMHTSVILMEQKITVSVSIHSSFPHARSLVSNPVFQLPEQSTIVLRIHGFTVRKKVDEQDATHIKKDCHHCLLCTPGPQSFQRSVAAFGKPLA